MTSGPALSKPADLLPFLTNLEEGSVLFIDEIHRMPRVVEEFIYPAMEDFRIDIVLGEGMSARTISMHLKRFTLIGATTRSGMLSRPDARPLQDARAPGVLLRRGAGHDRPGERGQAEHADHRRRGASNWPSAAGARRGSPTPGSTGRGATPPRGTTGRSPWTIARAALDMAEVDRDGLDKNDRQYLETLIDVFGGGPTGVEALAATMNLPADTLSDEIEPYLLREQYMVRTPRGRNVTTRAYQLLKREPPPRPDINLQPGLFE